VFGKSLKLFNLFGFSVKVDVSWIVIAVLVAWSLSVGFFPQKIENLSSRTYWLMGIVGALGLFASIIFHEMCHSLVARQFGLQMKGITLFIFGGVAEMEEEPPSAKAEFVMAIAGPISSIILATGFYAVYFIGGRGLWPQPINAIFGYLGMINGVLAVFNMVPAFPLDGGRMLRAALWHWKDNIKWATRIASYTGSVFGTFLIIMGVLNVLAGHFVGGMWWFLIGMFLRGAARMSYQQLVTRQALEGEPVSRFMESSPVTVPISTSIQDLVENYVYKYHFKMFPVVQNGSLMGCITTRNVKETPKEEWSSRSVGEVKMECSSDNTIPPDADSVKVLAKMRKANISRLLVVENDKLLGIVSLKDLLEFLALKVELEEES
jgi:Zn-dependent protease